MICHGSSSPRAIKNAIWAVERGFDQKVNERIADAIKLEGEPDQSKAEVDLKG